MTEAVPDNIRNDGEKSKKGTSKLTGIYVIWHHRQKRVASSSGVPAARAVSLLMGSKGRGIFQKILF